MIQAFTIYIWVFSSIKVKRLSTGFVWETDWYSYWISQVKSRTHKRRNIKKSTTHMVVEKCKTWSITMRVSPATTAMNFLSTWLRTLAFSREVLSMVVGTNESRIRWKESEEMSRMVSWSLLWHRASPPCMDDKVHFTETINQKILWQNTCNCTNTSKFYIH